MALLFATVFLNEQLNCGYLLMIQNYLINSLKFVMQDNLPINNFKRIFLRHFYTSNISFFNYSMKIKKALRMACVNQGEDFHFLFIDIFWCHV